MQLNVLTTPHKVVVLRVKRGGGGGGGEGGVMMNYGYLPSSFTNAEQFTYLAKPPNLSTKSADILSISIPPLPLPL
jgi:hypothetical protein